MEVVLCPGSVSESNQILARQRPEGPVGSRVHTMNWKRGLNEVDRVSVPMEQALNADGGRLAVAGSDRLSRGLEADQCGRYSADRYPVRRPAPDVGIRSEPYQSNLVQSTPASGTSRP